MKPRWKLALSVCCLSTLVTANGFGFQRDQSREERLRRDRREKDELDREFKKKYEADWRAYLSANDHAYSRWDITPLKLRRQYQSDRIARGLLRLPFRLLHR